MHEGSLFVQSIKAEIKGNLTYFADLDVHNALGNITRLENAFSNIPKRFKRLEDKLGKLKADISTAEKELTKSFPQEEEFVTKSARLEELNKIFNVEEEIIAEISDDDEDNNTENYSEISKVNIENCGTNTTNAENSTEEKSNVENNAENKSKNKGMSM
jgi:hypothetical protein